MTITVFSADDGFGNELWATDGTSGRTFKLMDINPAAFTGSDPSNELNPDPYGGQLSFAVLGGYAYFSADDGTHGRELWRTDGTAAGTVLVTDMASSGYNPKSIMVANGMLFFDATGPGGYGVYSSTGVPGSTPTLISATVNMSDFTVNGNRAYWIQNAGGSDNGLYTSDGVGAVQKLDTGIGNSSALVNAGDQLILVSNNGISRVSDTTVTPITGPVGYGDGFTNAGGNIFFAVPNIINFYTSLYVIASGSNTATLLSSDFSSLSPHTDFAALGNKLVFTDAVGTRVTQLWVSDGTAGGTVKLMDVHPDANSPVFPYAGELVTMGSNVYFWVADGFGDSELWKTDGTLAGTGMVKQISRGNPGHGVPATAGDFGNMSVQGGLLYFSAFSFDGGRELWRSDGTADGTFQVKDINNFASSITTSQAHSTPAVLGGVTYFMGDDLAHGNELWATDGTVAGTHLVADLNPGAYSSNPGNLIVVGGQLFFSADDGQHGTEMWVSDGTAAGTHMVRDIAAGRDGSTADGTTAVEVGFPIFYAFGNSVLFGASDGVHGSQLWISSGAAAGTMALSSAVPGADGTGFAIAGTQLFLTGPTGSGGKNLYVTDGTAAGTHLVEQLPGADNANVNLVPEQTAALGNTLFFAMNDGVHGNELWRSDGTAPGTFLLKDINASTGSGPLNPMTAGGKLYFTAFDGTSTQVWVSDGSTVGTVATASIAWTSAPHNLVASGSRVYFLGNTGSGDKLYSTNGTVPLQLSSITPNNANGYKAAAGGLFFTADDGSHGLELWFSGGLPGSTGMVTDIRPSGSAFPSNLTPAGNRLFFTANDGSHGNELWVSDGTAGGTHMVKDITVGSGSSGITYIQTAGNNVIFAPHGSQLWISDGTDAGTVLLVNQVVPVDSNPANFTALPGSLDAGPETLNGTASNDHIDGGFGNDTLNGLAGDDVFNGGQGNDTIDGGAGFDIATYGAAPFGFYTFFPNQINHTILVAGNLGSSILDGSDTLTNVEQLKFPDAIVSVDVSGTGPWFLQITGIDSAGSITQRSVREYSGNVWTNTFDTTNANATLWTARHYDNNGNLMQQTVTNDDGTHALTIYDVGNQYAWTNATISYDATWNVTGVSGTQDSGAAPVTMAQIASAFDTLLWFTTPYDINRTATPQVFGEKPIDVTLTGGGNIDVLFGYGGNDTFNGGAGNDQLTGGAGDDTLSGGIGNDVFHFQYGDGHDVIMDFAPGASSNDVIDLHNYGIANFAALQALMTQTYYDGTLITFDGDNSIILRGVDMAQLNAADFTFS